MRTVTCCLIAVSLLLTGCGPVGSPASPATTSEKTIVTTFLPYYVFTKNLVGENANVINIINNTQEPHDYQLKPYDVSTLQKADLIIRNGLGLDDWIEEAATKSGTKAPILTASDYITLLPLQQNSETATKNTVAHGVTIFDPHVWVSPKNALKILPHIKEQLQKIDPSNSENYEHNFQTYRDRLASLDQNISTQLSPYHDKEFISFHEAFRYFAHDYGLVSAIAIEAYPGQEPTPQYLQALVNKIKSTHIKAIFSEPQFSPRIIAVLANDLGLKVYSLDPLETGTYSTTVYEEITLQNVKNIVDALKL